MSFAATIDTLKFSKRMQKAGFEKKAADELAEAIKETQDQSRENVATKQDIELLRKDLQNIEQKVIARVGTMMTIAVGIIIAVIKL